MTVPITLLLGAGASKPLGIPTTIEMAEEYLSQVKSEFLKNIPRDRINDIEKLITVVKRIVDFPQNEAYSLVKDDIPQETQAKIEALKIGFGLLDEYLLKFVRQKCMVFNSSKAAGLYLPILDLASQDQIIQIFTTNYDTAIETVCREQKVNYTDGFKTLPYDDFPSFDPTNFNDEQMRVKLYKLHGSVNWWSNETRRTIFRLSLELDGVRDIKNLMIYPAMKDDIYNYPFNILQSSFVTTLHNTQELIAIGHKFGDLNILSPVKAALERPDFSLTIVNPEADVIKKSVFADHPRVQAKVMKFEEWVGPFITEMNERNKRLNELLEATEKWRTDVLSKPKQGRNYFVLRMKCPGCGNTFLGNLESKSGKFRCPTCDRNFGYSIED